MESRALPCLWLPAHRSACVLIYFHANAEDLGVVHDALQHLQKQLQITVLAIEYPGYGLLKEQTPSEESICNAAMVALRYLVSEIGINYSQVMLLGRSLGSSPAVFLASRFPVGGLLLVNAFTSLANVGELFVGSSVSRMVFGNTWNNESIIGNVSCAVLLIHAARDRTVPTGHSATLFEKCRSRKLLVTPEHMEHNSHLFADPSFLTVPAIHFFHFPCYQTDNPPTLPPHVFMPPPLVAPNIIRPPWACSGPACAFKGNAREDEVAVPAGAAVLGHIDVVDKMTTTTAKASHPPRNDDRGALLLSATLAAQNLSLAPVEESVVRGFVEAGVDGSEFIAPGDESVGWRTQESHAISDALVMQSGIVPPSRAQLKM